jgi:hypothetical protein
MSGTINISRRLFLSEAFRDEPFTEREAWVWLVMEASWKDRTVRAGDYVAETKRGQMAGSVRFMAKAWSWTAAKVQRYLKRIEKLKMISIETDTGISVITICNYDKYQNGAQASDTDAIQDRYRCDTNEKKDSIPEVIKKERVSNETLVHFDIFWAAWPVKNAKAAAVKAWAKLPQHDRLAALGNAKSFFERWRAEYPTANPIHPASYLNGRRWEDELDSKFKAINGGVNGQAGNYQSYADRPNHRSDATMSNILRLAGVGQTPGDGGS